MPWRDWPSRIDAIVSGAATVVEGVVAGIPPGAQDRVERGQRLAERP
jgi:hypothetical protein